MVAIEKTIIIILLLEAGIRYEYGNVADYSSDAAFVTVIEVYGPQYLHITCTAYTFLLHTLFCTKLFK